MKQRNHIWSGMEMTLSSSSSTLYLFTTFFLFNLTSAIAADESNTTDFIRASCHETLYPDVCYCSLSTYANSIHQDSGQLAKIAISVTLNNAQNMASFLSNLTHHPSGGGGREADVVQECAGNLDDAIDEIRGSLKQMRHLHSGPISSSFRFQMSNVQTWMSAALTDEETCTDGFDEVPDDDGGVKEKVCGRAGELKKLTSNALALVNSYINKQQGLMTVEENKTSEGKN